MRIIVIRAVGFVSAVLKTLFMGLMVCALPAIGAPASGPLQVHPTNPRYFTDGSGKAIYLVGSHTWDNRQDSAGISFDYNAYLNFLTSHNHNFFRLWVWEQAKWEPYLDYQANRVFSPTIYTRPGPGTAKDGLPKFDVSRFNQPFFDRLRQRVVDAGNKGIYVSVMLFNGWSIVNKGASTNSWNGHPFNRDNNINGIDGDPNYDGNGEEVDTLDVPAIKVLQEAYLRKVIDTVNDLDNVLYEVSNESDGTAAATQWEYWVIDFVKQYEAGKAKRHPVGMTVQWPNGSNNDIFNSAADWVSPNPWVTSPYDYRSNPPPADGRKVIVNDTDHLAGLGGDRSWLWKSFCRGLNFLYMDSYSDQYAGDWFNFSPDESLRRNMGYALAYANKINLAAMQPRGDLATSSYCLANTGSNAEYLVYLPTGGSVTVDLSATNSNLNVEWLNPATGDQLLGNVVSGGGLRTFTAPFSGDAVLYLAEQIAAPVPPVASFSVSPTLAETGQEVTLDAFGSNDPDGVIVDWNWDFGDGSTGSGETINHAYSAANQYTVELTVRDNSGMIGKSTSNVTVTQAAAAIDLPGRIEAENYLAGGEGTGYHDTTLGNSGGQYRTDDVDIALSEDAGGGYCVGWIAQGEWLAYTVNVTQAGIYDLKARVATIYDGRSLHVELDGINISGQMAVPNTAGWLAWQDVTVTGVNLPTGVHELRIVADTSAFNINFLDVVSSATQPQSPIAAIQTVPATPLVQVGKPITFDASKSFDPDGSIVLWSWDFGDSYGASGQTVDHIYTTAGNYNVMLTLEDNDGLTSTSHLQVSVSDSEVFIDIPGRIEAEYYRVGGEGLGYHDTTIGNSGGQYRADDVDIALSEDTGGGYCVGWIAQGEWLAFTVNVAQAGRYDFIARLATIYDGRILHVELDGVDVTGQIWVPNTGGWLTWKDVKVTGVDLPAGVHEMRFVADTSAFNINYLDVTASQ